MSKRKITPSQLGSSLSRIKSALDEWDELQKKSNGGGDHPADIHLKTKKLLKDLRDQINELEL